MPQMESPSFSRAGDDTSSPPPTFSAALPLEPRAEHFVVSWTEANGNLQEVPLFAACGGRLRTMQALVDEARALVSAVHGDDVISEPPLCK
jgi:hypothetical protein